jgi:hypothetical protein
MVIQRRNISIKRPDRPVVFGGFLQVPGLSILVCKAHNQSNMGPGQFGAQCAPNLLIGESKIKLPVFAQTTLAKAFSKLKDKFMGQVLDEFLAIFRPFLALLFFLDNPLADEPVSLYHRGVDGPVRLLPGIGDDLLDFLDVGLRVNNFIPSFSDHKNFPLLAAELFL